MDSKKAADEWISFDERQLDYHKEQWQNTKESTKAFETFSADYLAKSRRVIDLGAGTGAATAYLARHHPETSFIAADYVPTFLELGAEIARNRGISNLEFRRVNWMDLPETGEFDGVISLQTLSWLPTAEEPLVQIFTKFQPKWIALTSLFYEGDISCTVSVKEHAHEKSYFYNVYAIPEIRRICSQHGYQVLEIKKFEIGIDLPPPENLDAMRTYTRRVATVPEYPIERLQISGPVLMPWHMLLIMRT